MSLTSLFEDAKRRVQAAPSDIGARSALWQIFALRGEFDRARLQLEALVSFDSSWAMEAEATGWGSKVRKNCVTGPFRSFWMISSTWAKGKGGTSSCNFFISTLNSSGRISVRVESAWPNLIKVGPSSVRAIRIRAPVESRASTSPSAARKRSLIKSIWVRLSQSASPYLLRTARISVQRRRFR